MKINSKYLEKVMMSCKTLDQLEVCEEWIGSILSNNCNLTTQLHLDLKFLRLKNQMSKYITRLGEISETK